MYKVHILFLIFCLTSAIIFHSCNPVEKNFPLNNGLVKAIKNKDPDKVKETIDSHQFDINAPDKNGATPIMYAAFLSTSEVVNVFIEKDAELNEKDSGGMTALMWAVKAGNTPVISLLLDAGATPSTINNEELTARDIAESMGNNEIVSILKTGEETHEERVYYVIDQLKETKFLYDKFSKTYSSPEYTPLLEEIDSLLSRAGEYLKRNNAVKSGNLLDAAFYLINETSDYAELENQKVTIKGRVVNNGLPVEGADVTALYVSDWAAKELVEFSTANTQADGRFSVDLFSGNCFFLEASAEGLSAAAYVDLNYAMEEEIIIDIKEGA
ncbi:MAG: ankyrin repeat domain-containing protein [Spirochaetales bacterium]|nr:ankyrin repeat domain-containing protein [Spirochaetales bacterium]